MLTRTPLTVVTFTAFLVFAVGLGRLLRSVRGGDAGLAGQVAITALLSYIGVTLVATSLEAGGSLLQPDGSTDPTKDGALTMGMVLLHGPIARILVATFLVSLVAALSGRGAFSRRVPTGSIVMAVASLALIPSLFFGTDPEPFYAAIGWGADALIGLLNVIWLAVLGCAVLRCRVTPISTSPRADDRLASY